MFPSEIVAHIFSYLKGVNCGASLAVCKTWQQTLDTPQIWQACLKAEFDSQRIFNYIPIKQEYKMRYLSSVRNCGMCGMDFFGTYAQEMFKGVLLCASCVAKHTNNTPAVSLLRLRVLVPLQLC